MKHVVMAWLGETMTGRGHAYCGTCGWRVDDRLYGEVAKAAIVHESRHEREGATA